MPVDLVWLGRLSKLFHARVKPFGLLSVLFGLLFLAPPAGAEILIYQLLPGSTITPMSGATATGPTEPLSGTFAWNPVLLSQFNEVAFQNMSFDLGSASYSLSLYTGTQVSSAAALNSDIFAFSINVNATGLSISSGTIIEYPNDGTYAGSPYAPAQINLPDLRMSPIGGGYYAAGLSLYAALVPEPSPCLLLSAAVLPLLVPAVRRRCRWA